MAIIKLTYIDWQSFRQLQAITMYIIIEWTTQLWRIPLAFCFSLFSFLLPPFVSLYLLETLLAVIGSRPPWSQVARKLISPFPSPPHSKIQTPWGFPELNMRLTKTTSQIWLTESRTVLNVWMFEIPTLWNRKISIEVGCTDVIAKAFFKASLQRTDLFAKRTGVLCDRAQSCRTVNYIRKTV
jgi:hypothetical protein